MADPIISPDGKWMWTGADWIPTPPTSELGVQQNINFKDSAIGGDINITNHNTSDFITGINHLLKVLVGEKEPPTLAKVIPKQETDRDDVDDATLIELTKMMLLSIKEVEPDILLNKGLISQLFDMEQKNLVRGCFLRLYYEAKNNDDKALLLVILGTCAEHDLREQNRCFAESARIRRENNLDIPEWLEKY